MTLSIFQLKLLWSFNTLIGTQLIKNCKCYNDYNKVENFYRTIVYERKSYMGCLIYDDYRTNKKKIKHQCVPIFLGSYIDFCIRGKKNVYKDMKRWCAVYISGNLKIYTSFSTFESLTMHVKQRNDSKEIEWFTYLNKEGLALSYKQDHTLTYTYMKETFDNIKYPYRWIEKINESNPFKNNFRKIESADYLNLFKSLLHNPNYHVNDLKNRRFISSPHVMKKYINNFINNNNNRNFANTKTILKKKKKNENIKDGFEKGNFYSVLAKNNKYESQEWCKKSVQNLDNNLNDGKFDKTRHFAINVNRASNEAFRNSKGLEFPKDAVCYFCLLNTKDLKSAGEQNALADFVLMTEETNQFEVYEYMKHLTPPPSPPPPPIDNDKIFVLNSYILKDVEKKSWTFQDLLDLKEKFPHITTQYCDNYVLISTKHSIPIKYNDEFDVYISVAEKQQFNIKFKEESLVSVTAKELGFIALRKNPCAKSTVAINNIKGSVANVSNRMDEKFMANSQGMTCFIKIDKKKKKKILNSAIISIDKNNEKQNKKKWNNWFKKILKFFNFKSKNLKDLQHEVKESLNLEKVNLTKCIKSFEKLYNHEELCLENLIKYEKNNKYSCFSLRNFKSLDKILDYKKLIENENNFKIKNSWNLKAWATFGNISGSCVEDGVILDETFVKNIPPICYNACITVDFTFSNKKKLKQSLFIPINFNNNNNTTTKTITNETLIGCLITEDEVSVKNSKHFEIRYGKIGNHFYHLLHFLHKKYDIYESLNLTWIYKEKILTIIMKGKYYSKVSIGTKIANAYGQKNICANIKDLRKQHWGMLSDGKTKVSAQILYSKQSILGRLTAGQLFECVTNKKLAIGPNGEIIAPININIHYLNSKTNNKIFDIKLDTLTHINGFDSQCLVNTTRLLRKSNVLPTILQLIDLHGFKITNHIKIKKKLKRLKNKRKT